MKYLIIVALIIQSQSIIAMQALKKKQSHIAQQSHQIEDKSFGQNISNGASYTYAPRALLIYLDDTEEELDAMGLSLLFAIGKNPGPIVASMHSMKLIKNESSDDIKNILNTSWIIKQINDDILFLIPLNYLKNIGLNPADVKKSGATTITETELALGLKVNHMEEKTLDTIKFFRFFLGAKKSDYFLPALYNSATHTSSIFCLRSDYTGHKNALPLWSIYMGGHGESARYSEKIAGISIADFKEVLDFLENKINTRLLVYVSCYAADINNETIYKAAKSPIQKTYSFPIITQALTDAPVSSRAALEKPEKFVQATTVPVSDAIDYGQAMQYLNPEARMAENTAQIKFPGTEWFSAINADKTVVQIGSILAENRGTHPLDIVQFFKMDPRILLLYAQDIPFELIINAPNLKSIVSMIPGAVTHTIERITSSSDTATILDWFMSIGMLNSQKIFYIKSINTLKDVIICNIPRFEYRPIIYERFALFKDDGGTLFVKECLTENGRVPQEYRQLVNIKKVDATSYSTVLPNKIYCEKMYADLLNYVRDLSSTRSAERKTLPPGLTGRGNNQQHPA